MKQNIAGEIAKIRQEMTAQDAYVQRLESQLGELKEELKRRPYQTNFTDRELEEQIKHFMELDKAREEAE